MSSMCSRGIIKQIIDKIPTNIYNMRLFSLERNAVVSPMRQEFVLEVLDV